jgi:phosphatidylserine decarboxylase
MSDPKTTTPQDKNSKKRKQVKDKLFVQAQHVIPQHLLSKGMYHLTRSEWEPLKKLMIEQAIKRFDIDMSIAMEPDPAAYPSFNAFFTRALREDARPIATDPRAICCPADGRVSQFGAIRDGRILQAKGRDYSVFELLGGDEKWSALFKQGQFITIYLSPRDYHRIHAPRDGTLHRTVHVPGKLFSVNPVTTRAVPRLFARNERLCCLFESDIGPLAVILVGAIFVSSIETVWGSEYLTPKEVAVSEFGPPAMSVELKRGEELGRFNMGSTVIMLLPKGHAHWPKSLKKGMRVKMGQAIAATHVGGEG